MTSVHVGIRLKALRAKRHLSQEDVAHIFGFENRQTVAQIEAGQRKLSAEELVAAVEAFDVQLDYFTNPFLIVGEARFSWRRSPNVPPGELSDFECKAGEWIGAYRELSEGIGQRLPAVLPRLSLTRGSSYEEAAEAGERIAAEYDLGDVPSQRLVEVMQERFSTLVLMVDARRGISGAACLVRDLGAALVNRHEAPGRRNFDLAHEFFHLLTWDAMPPEHIDGSSQGKAQKRIEEMANCFASALLMPRATLDRYDGPVTDAAWLNATASQLQVTALALKWRLRSVGRITSKVAQEFDDGLLVNNGQAQASPADPPPPFGRRFMKVVAAGIDHGKISVRRAARLLDVSIDELGELCDIHGIDRPFEL